MKKQPSRNVLSLEKMRITTLGNLHVIKGGADITSVNSPDAHNSTKTKPIGDSDI